MTTYFLIGKYSQESLKHISSQRTKKAYQIIQKLGGRIKSIYALLGEKDLIIQAQFPGSKQAMNASLGLTKITGIGFSTSEAISIDEFDKLAKV